MVANQTQGTQAKTFALDPTGRLRSITTTATNLTETNHYTDSTDSPAWQAGSDNTWTRNIQDPAGNLAAITTNTGSNELQLANIHGDIVATAPNTTTATGTDNYFESTEFGIARTTNTTTPRYGWLGTKRRDSTDTLAAITLMGQRLYNPTTGRFLQTDPVPGGSANNYDYCTADPLNCTDLNGQWGWWHHVWHYAYSFARSRTSPKYYVSPFEWWKSYSGPTWARRVWFTYHFIRTRLSNAYYRLRNWGSTIEHDLERTKPPLPPYEEERYGGWGRHSVRYV